MVVWSGMSLKFESGVEGDPDLGPDPECDPVEDGFFARNLRISLIDRQSRAFAMHRSASSRWVLMFRTTPQDTGTTPFSDDKTPSSKSSSVSI